MCGAYVLSALVHELLDMAGDSGILLFLGVDPHGRLLLTTGDGHRLSCGMKEIVFL